MKRKIVRVALQGASIALMGAGAALCVRAVWLFSPIGGMALGGIVLIAVGLGLDLMVPFDGGDKK